MAVFFRYISRKKRYAMLDTLLTAEKMGEIDENGIKEEVINFMFAGHDTTSIALTFILFLISHHPEAQDRILEEIQQVKRDKNSDEITMNDLSDMKYLDCAIKECLRIYPPVPFISKFWINDGTFFMKILISGRSLTQPLDMSEQNSKHEFFNFIGNFFIIFRWFETPSRYNSSSAHLRPSQRSKIFSRPRKV